jgi:hypothetical protein
MRLFVRITDPEVMVKIQVVNLALWIVMTFVSTVTGLIHSNDYISEVSNVALILSAGAWLESAHIRRANQREDLVTDLVERTNIESQED